MKRWMITALLLPTLCFATNAINVIGVGAKSRGMGGVGVALSQDAFAGAMNPAALGYQCSRTDVGLGSTWQNGWTRVVTEENGAIDETQFDNRQNYPLPEVAACWRFCSSQVVGIALYPAAAASTHYNNRPFMPHQSSALRYYNLFVTPSWSWRINCYHTVGISANFSFAGLKVEGLNTAFSPNSIHPEDVSNRGLNTSQGFSFAVGWMGHFRDRVNVGAKVETKTWSRRYKSYQGLLVDEGRMEIAPIAGLGIAWRASPCVVIAADLLYRLWQRSEQFDNTSRESGVLFGGFGGEDGPGFGWKNQMIVKLGISWAVWPCLSVRAGYNYGQPPLAQSETVLNALLLPVQEHHATFGATARWRCYELTLFYYHAFDRLVTGLGSTPFQSTEWDLRNGQNSCGLSLGLLY